MFLETVALLVFCMTYVWRKRHIYKLSWQLPGPFALPLIGNGISFMCKDEDLLERIDNMMSQYPSPMRIWMGPKLAIIYTDPNQVEKFMNSSKFSTKDDLYKLQEPFLGTGLITSSGVCYRADKKMIAPMLTAKSSETYMQIFQEESESLVNCLKEMVDAPLFDVELKVNRCAHNIIARTMAGYSPEAELGKVDVFLKTVHSVYILVHSRIMKFWLQFDPLYRFTPTGKYQERSIDVIHSVMRQWLDFSRKSVACDSDDVKPEAIIQKLLKQNNFKTEQDFIYHITTIYVAGADTITAISSFMLVMMGMHPECQKLVHEELDQVFGTTFRRVEMEDLNQMPFLDRCIKETLRLFPIAAFIMRQASEDVQIDDYFIPQGCSVGVAIHCIHRSKRHWLHPNEFYPDHFLPENVKMRHPYAFIPFSVGSRGCIGKAYAYMALRTILATVLQKYRFEVDGTMKDFKIKTDISIRPKQGYLLRVKTR